jgi:glycerol-3-phosphate dehydrogenase
MELYDAVVVGAGVVGCAIARELSRYDLKILVLEKELDVATGNSSRNTGMLHAGFTYKLGTLRAKCSVEGNQEFDQVSQELGVPFKRTGKLVVGFTDHDRENILRFKANGEANGVKGIRMVDPEEMHRIEPNAGGNFAMYVPASGILDPMQYTIALGENACKNGAEFSFGSRVIGIEPLDGARQQQVLDQAEKGRVYQITTNRGMVCSRWVINSAGAYAVKIGQLMGYPAVPQIGTKGEYYVLDKKAGAFLKTPVYPAPNDRGGFVTHATPTVDGNILVGPDWYTTTGPEDYANQQQSLDRLFQDGRKMFKKMERQYFIRNFVGIRWRNCDPVTKEPLDFRIMTDPSIPHTVSLVGIESPGVTAALPLARRVVDILVGETENEGGKVTKKQDFDPIRKPIRRFAEMSLEEKEAAIRENPAYGQVFCRCENVSKAEILQAIHNPLGVHTLTGIKNRTRSMMGRCQGGYCQTRITHLLEQELGTAPEDLRYQREGGWLFTGEVRPETKGEE